MDEISSFQLRLTNDHAVSPVVGTILMVAVTVALGATVLAIMSNIGDEGLQESANAVFKAAGVDTDGDAKTDKIKITYVSGPTGLISGDVLIAIADGAGGEMTAADAAWSPGDFRLYDTSGTTPSAGQWFITVSVLGGTVLDTSLELAE